MPESEPRLIRGYLQVLAAQLPGPIVEELADGLTETYRSYRTRGLPADAAAEAAVEEFGSAEEILAGFARVNPARQAARRLLGLGPVVGGCWAAALATSRVWPGPEPARVVLGVVLAACIGLLFVAALDRRYRVAVYSGIAGCAGFAALDASLIVGTLVVAGRASGLTALAIAVSSARIALCARAAVASQQNT
jgi:hypothetical protein